MATFKGKALKLENGKYIIPSNSEYPMFIRGKILEEEDFEYDDSFQSINKLNYINKVKEFMSTFGEPVVNKPTEMPEDRNKLKISLIFEELKEYAEASGMEAEFSEMCINFSANFAKYSNNKASNINLIEQLDALCDLQYVVSGAVLENGFGSIFDKAFAEVHRSNMSKACNTEDEALDTCEKYKDTPAYFSNEQRPIIVYRKSDNKILKSINYSPANLKQFIK